MAGWAEAGSAEVAGWAVTAVVDWDWAEEGPEWVVRVGLGLEAAERGTPKVQTSYFLWPGRTTTGPFPERGPFQERGPGQQELMSRRCLAQALIWCRCRR